MAGIRLDRDLIPVSEFRANVATLIERVKATGRSIVLTQHGRAAAVLVDPRSYQELATARERAIGSRPAPSPETDPVAAYKSDVDRPLLRESLEQPAHERLRRLEELSRFADELRGGTRKQQAADASTQDRDATP